MYCFIQNYIVQFVKYFSKQTLGSMVVLIYFVFSSQNIQASSHHPQDFLKAIKGSKDEGAQIVQHYCINCHAKKPSIPLGAPRIGVTKDWEPRIKQGIEKLFQHTDEGINAMPPRGGCFECTDKQLLLAIISMLPEELQSKLKGSKMITK